ncbi:nickel pincer cofactor biosynthesis protein LarB [Rubinisphaera italica]|uniref:AIR carboxylase n=1 Tax=Rubinisphaera italica TaxID=2527969 RepID=A0A5C5XNK3_9PLAN|nr:nickel pincer cofactor biosynthesis protein LarB [Rubinisphaera italica]TWT64119.1 AIR carboxylase [Rubinisphaera italica]
MSNSDSLNLSTLLEAVASGSLDVASAMQQIEVADQSTKSETIDLDLDIDRQKRCGFPEAIYGAGKPAEVIVEAFRKLISVGQNCLATRVEEAQAEVVLTKLPDVNWNPIARTLRLMVSENAAEMSKSGTCVVTAGTTDRPVAEEAAETLRWMNFEPGVIYDAGVAGPHRLLKSLPKLESAKAIVVVAGMEGALPSVVGGWVACPVIAVPTSVGYGANFGGLSALLGMLNSCAANVCTVNIDGGFKGGYLAGLIASQSDSSN